MTQNDDPLVSVIIPSFNSANYIAETINSVLDQTVGSLEVLVIDDASTDETVSIVRALSIADGRIELMVQAENKGVALARNRALEVARGRYIAYLDSDDLWMSKKLERQLTFMKRAGVGACFTSYETIEEDGTHRNVVHVPESIDYKGFLKNTITCSHTLLFDTEKVDKSLLVMPNLRRGQDAATWLQVLKAGHRLYGLDEVLAKNRKRTSSLSSKKLTAIKRTWNLYRNVEHLCLPYAFYCQFWQLFHAVMKRRRKG